MNPDTFDFVHLTLFAMKNGIQGKTKLQKTVYFAGLLTQQLDNLGYHAHFYGPYTEDVAFAAGQLVAFGFADTHTTAWGYDHRGFERFRTDYELNDAGILVAKQKAHKYPELWAKIQESVELLQKAGDQHYMKLSIAAKTHFLLGEKGGHASKEQLAELAPEFGWDVSVDQITEAAQYLASLDLVKVPDN